MTESSEKEMLGKFGKSDRESNDSDFLLPR